MLDTTSDAWKAGVAMGERHANTGDPNDFSDARCKPLEHERDEEARRFDPRSPLGSANFNEGYDYGYQRVLDAGDEEDESEECPGHPADEFSPMGETVYCDGSCQR